MPVECPLSQPWMYQRSGIYYLRVRPKGGSKESVTVSLQTSDKQIAEAASKLLMSSLYDFQHDNPAAEWRDLAAHLKSASKAVSPLSEGEYLDAGPKVYAEVLSELQQAVAARKRSKAAALRDSFARRGVSNPIGKFTCPHCLEDDCDVEYVKPSLKFPSGCSGVSEADIDAGRCFQCGGVSYWIVVDSNAAPDRADLKRRLLFPLVTDAGSRLFTRFIADGIRGNPQALDNFIENIKKGIPLEEFAKRAELRAKHDKGAS
ncbi:hypothetical protein AABC73_02000 [Pseudomonas sp. G.S.17]|uniref:hypothetical protein n=1 Tax=Pseudomonas sp. G.S.17 TaxID=3137451 RepID=UPI00311CC85F